MPRLSPNIGQPLPWGSHLCAFYRSTAELHIIARSYIETGLRDHEGCLWILPPSLSVSAAIVLLQRTIPKVHDYLLTGQLDLLSFQDWYHPEGSKNADAIVETCLRKIVRVAPRFSGFRVTGDVAWLESPTQRTQFLAYEHKVTEAVGKADIVALCTYPAEAWSPPDILHVFECHDSVLLIDQTGWEEVKIRAVQPITGHDRLKETISPPSRGH